MNKNVAPVFAFIESNTTGTGHLFLQLARKKNYIPIFICKNPERYHFLEKELIHPIVIDTNDKEAVLSCLAEIENLHGVFSTSDYFIETASYCAKKLNLPGTHPEIIALCRSKNLLAKTLADQGISVPESVHITSEKQLEQALRQLQFPVVVKPAEGTGSINVKLCRNSKECSDFAKQLLNKQPNSLLIQSYIDGKEYSIETIGLGDRIEVIGITKKYLSDLPYFLETGHDFPAPIADDLENILRDFITTILTRINFMFGPAHTEVRIVKNQPYLIEINPRLAGGMIPELVRAATGVDLISLIFDLYTSKEIPIKHQYKRHASIRFLIPKQKGIIAKLVNHNQTPFSQAVHAFSFTQNPGSTIQLLGDFRDRVGYIITQGNSLKESAAAAENFIQKIEISMSETDPSQENAFADTGLLKQTLHPEALAIINGCTRENSQELKRKEFSYLAAIDEAHLLMLTEMQIIPVEKTIILLQAIQALKKENFDCLLERTAPRGNYLTYEKEIIDRTNKNIGGYLHTARSRNDIKATIFKLQTREYYFQLSEALWQFRSTLIRIASTSLSAPIPIYSQYQTALPGTLAFYLLGIEQALARDQSALQHLFGFIMECPLGACAGGGTSFNISPSITANLLGFTNTANNALDAVASRDLALRLLAWASITGMNLSRFAEDLHLWSTNEFNFIEFPDFLCGGSSMMPQKKNPYLLEKIKGNTARLSGSFISAISLMNKVPFGNSMEVGTEALKEYYNSLIDLIDGIKLSELLINNLSVIRQNTEKAITQSLSMATCISEILIQNYQYSHKEAHYKVGETIRNAITNNIDAYTAILNLIPQESAQHFSVMDWVNKLSYGSGPGIETSLQQIKKSNARLIQEQTLIYTQKEQVILAEKDRDQRIQQLIAYETA